VHKVRLEFPLIIRLDRPIVHNAGLKNVEGIAHELSTQSLMNQLAILLLYLESHCSHMRLAHLISDIRVAVIIEDVSLVISVLLFAQKTDTDGLLVF
jgi:hypothetical protein